MLPQNVYAEIDSDSKEAMPSRTYCIDSENKLVCGYVDDVGAIRQAIRKIFKTERFAYEIYSQNYGIELEGLIGADMNFVKAVFESRVQEALLADDRILSISNFEMTQLNIESLQVEFVAVTKFGNIEIQEEVSIL